MKPPIADPFAPPSPSEDEETRVFKHSFWRVYFGTLLASLIFGPLMLLPLWLLNGPDFLARSGGFLLFILVGLNPFSAAFGALFRPTRVTPRGIQGPLVTGFVEWERMKRVRRFWLGYFTLQIHLRIRFSSLWIPLSFRDSKAFAQTIEEWAPEGHPLRLFLDKHNLK